MSLIEQLNLPQELKKLNKQEKKQVIQELKALMLQLSKLRAIHYSSNLGVIELTLALLIVFDTKTTDIIFDIGHQSYIYKILTDRFKKIDTIRTYHGLSGFQNPNESIYDKWSAGHAATGISAAIGLKKENLHTVICIVGDGALSSGLSLEGLDSLASLNLPILIIVNDNDMSIAKNFGGMHHALIQARNGIHPNIFENFGFKYYFLKNGHNLDELIALFQKVKKEIIQTNKTIIVHIKTKKGSDVVNDIDGRYHSYQYQKDSNIKIANSNGAYLAQHLISKISQNKKLIIVSPSMTYSTGFSLLKEKYSNQFIDLGIQEENAVTICAGLSMQQRFLPILVTYSTFIQRSYDQLLHDVARQNLPLILLLDRSDLATGDGSSHMGIYDVAMLKSIPNTVISSGMTKEQNAKLLDYFIQNNTDYIASIRYAGSEFLQDADLTQEINRFELHDKSWQILKHQPTDQICFISYGTYYFKIYQKLRNLKNVTFVNALFIHTQNQKNFEFIQKHNFKKIIIYERINETNTLADELKIYFFEHQLNTKIIALHYHGFLEQGSVDELDQAYEMDLETIQKFLNN